jgi:hypothetical protein
MTIDGFKLDNVINAIDAARSYVRILKLQDGLTEEGMILRHDVDLDVEYDPRIFGPDIYASDSRMREVDIPEFAARNKGRTSQLLLHPMHYSHAGEPYPAPMIEYALRHITNLDEDFCKNSAYKSARRDVTLIEHVNEFTKRKRSS